MAMARYDVSYGHDVFRNRLTVIGRLKTATALHIGSGRSTGATELDLPVVKDAAGDPFIPGSSLKGALRSRAEQLLRTLDLSGRGACDPFSKPCVGPDELRDIKTPGARDDRVSDEVMGRLCHVCRVFGNPCFASKILIRDLHVDRGTWTGRYATRDGVSIDRDTLTASGQRLYTIETVPPGVEFSLEIVVENASEEEHGLVWMVLRELEPAGGFASGRLCIGGGTSRGLGRVSLIEARSTLIGSVRELVLGGARTLTRAEEDARIEAMFKGLGVTTSAQAASE